MPGTGVGSMGISVEWGQFQFRKVKNSGVDDGESCTACVFSVPLNCTVKCG